MSTTRPPLPPLIIPRKVFSFDQSSEIHDPIATEIITIGKSKIFLGAEHDASQESVSARNIKAIVRVIPDKLTIKNDDCEVFHIDDVRDSPSVQISKYFNAFEEFVDKQINEEKNILVHCRAGISRSATLLISYLMKKNKLSMTDAMKFVKDKRRQVWPNFGFCLQLMNLETTLGINKEIKIS